MQKLIIYAIFLGLLSACASQYGNYTKLPESGNAQMADDAVQELVSLYPPASTRFTLSQSTKDAYGVELVKDLRENGYAIEDGDSVNSLFSSTASLPTASSKPDLSKNHTNPEPSAAAPVIQTAGADSAQSTHRSIGYIVDQIETGLYRVTIVIDSHVLSRVYTGSSKGMLPAGSWTRKE